MKLYSTNNEIIFGQEITEDITVKADGVIIQNCKINGNVYVENATNCLIAQNDISGNITAKNTYNSVILLNKAQNITAESNINLYVVENTLSGTLTLNSNNYLLADENTSAETIYKNNENFNGDDLTDVDARLDHGADLDLLPHANKELFVGMPRRNAVNANDTDGTEPVNAYITARANGGTIIVPPGAYSAPAPVKLEASASGSTIYAYGAFMEMLPYGNSFVITNGKNITVKGLVIGYAQQPCGQVTLVEEIDKYTFLAPPTQALSTALVRPTPNSSAAVLPTSSPRARSTLGEHLAARMISKSLITDYIRSRYGIAIPSRTTLRKARDLQTAWSVPTKYPYL